MVNFKLDEEVSGQKKLYVFVVVEKEMRNGTI